MTGNLPQLIAVLPHTLATPSQSGLLLCRMYCRAARRVVQEAWPSYASGEREEARAGRHAHRAGAAWGGLLGLHGLHGQLNAAFSSYPLYLASSLTLFHSRADCLGTVLRTPNVSPRYAS